MAIIKDRLSYVRGLPLNRYRLVLGAIVIIGVILAYSYSPLTQPLNTIKTTNPATTNQVSTAPILTTPEQSAVSNPKSGINSSGMPLDMLFNEISGVFHELITTSSLMTNPLAPAKPPDETTIQLYQPQIERLQQRLVQLQQRALTLSKTDSQRFLWNLLVETNFPLDNSHLLLNTLTDTDDALLDDMLMTLSNGGYAVETRQMLAYNLLLPQQTASVSSSTSVAQKADTSMARQAHLKRFLDEQLQIEQDPRVLATYMEIYHTWANDGRLVNKEAFKQQLEQVRNQLAPDQYFGFRLQTLNLSDPSADYAGLFADISATPMDKTLKRNLLLRLADEISTRLTSNDNTTSADELPDTTRQVLLQYLQTNLPQPTLEDSFSLYQYGTQVYTLLLLTDRQQANDKLYQRILSSRSLAEQLGMLSALPLTDGIAQKNLREHTHLRQTLEQALTQPNLSSEARTSLSSGLSSLMLQPPTVSTESNPSASAEDQSNLPKQTMPYTDWPVQQ